MKLVIFSLGLFFIMKLIYGFWGDYSNDYWSVIYYMVNYFMMISVFMYMYVSAESKIQRWFFILAIVYFIALFLLHLACLVWIQLYGTLVSDVGYFGVGAVTLTIGILYLKRKLKKGHA